VLLVGLVGGAHRAGFIRVPGEPDIGVVSPTPTPTDGSVTPTPPPSPTPTPTVPPTPDIAGRLPIEACKIGNSKEVDFASGFPISQYAATAATGTIRVALAFVDFPNSQETGSIDSAFEKIASRVSAVYKEMSYGKLNVEFVKISGWTRMDKASNAYQISQEGRGDYEDTVAYAREVIGKTDPTVDFTGVDLIVVFASEEAPGIAGDYEQTLSEPLRTKEASNIQSVIVSGGGWWLQSWDPTAVSHEFGHTLGLADLYDSEAGKNGPINPFVGDFDFMSFSYEESLAPSFLGWNRWRLGWISDEAVICLKPTAENRVTLSPLQSGKGALLAIVPLSATRVLVMESRRAIGIDSKLPDSGVLVYIVDSRVDSGLGPIRVQGTWTSESMSEALLGVGEYLEASGWVVSVTRNEVWGNEFAIFP
jgi:M6 family metalloprotease-like protein